MNGCIRYVRKWITDYEIVFMIAIVVLGLFQVYRCEYPGLYLDTVNPDYLAVQILFPQIQNPSMLMPQTGFPMLGQLYHGTVTVWLQLLLIGLSGKASVFILRLANMIYVFGICIFMYAILKKMKVNLCVSMLLLFMLIMSPQVFSFVRTQYYIKLPGTLFLFISIYFLIEMCSKKKSAWRLILSGFFCGLAFYSYFIYLFFVPAMLVLCTVCSDTDKKIKNGLFWISGFCNGAVLYGLGYMDLMITEKFKWGKRIVGIADFVIVVIGWGFLFLLAQNYNKRKKLIFIFKIILLTVLLLSILIIVKIGSILEILFPWLNSLQITGESMNLVQRVKHVFFLWQGVLNNRFSEWLMLSFSSSILPNLFIAALFIETIGVFFVCLKKKKKDILYKFIVFLLFMQVSYAIISILFISRMGGQHFTPMFFLGFFMFIVECGYLISTVKCFWYKAANMIFILAVFFINIANTSLLDTNLDMSGGSKMYTSQINEMSDCALKNKRHGIKEVYVFPEWGFLCGFNYLTMNQVHIMTNMDTDRLNQYIADGYRIKVCLWQKDKVGQYLSDLENAGIGNLIVQGEETKMETEGFYMIEQEDEKPVEEANVYGK